MSSKPPAESSLKHFTLRWSKDDAALARELQELTGAVSTAAVVRAAMRAHYRAITHHPFRRSKPSEAPPPPQATGTEG